MMDFPFSRLFLKTSDPVLQNRRGRVGIKKKKTVLTLQTIKKITAVLKDISHEKNDFSIFFL